MKGDEDVAVRYWVRDGQWGWSLWIRGRYAYVSDTYESESAARHDCRRVAHAIREAARTQTTEVRKNGISLAEGSPP